MHHVKYLLIGGGLASLRAAEQIRAIDPNGSVLMACEEPVAPYDRPPLSKQYLKGDRGAVELKASDELALSGLVYRLSQPVLSLDVEAKTAVLAGGETVTFEKALIATGGRPVQLDLPGSELEGVHYLRTLADADALLRQAQPGRKAVVIGGGFIGLEVAATLQALGLDVTVVEALPRIWARFGNEDLSSFITGYSQARGVRILTSTLVREFGGQGKITEVITETGEAIACDLVCVGVGIRPNVELAEQAGLTVNDGVVVDGNMRTSHTDVFAAGDLINYPDPIAGRRRRVEHWGHAEHSGQVAGRCMAGVETAYELVSYVWSDVFDLHFEFAGDEHGADTQVRRGDPTNGAFMLVGLKAGKVVSFAAVNTPAKDYSMIRRMIQKGTDLTGRLDQLADEAVALRTLV